MYQAVFKYDVTNALCKVVVSRIYVRVVKKFLPIGITLIPSHSYFNLEIYAFISTADF